MVLLINPCIKLHNPIKHKFICDAMNIFQILKKFILCCVDIDHTNMINVKFTWVLLRVENWCNLCYIYVPWHITEASCRWLHEYPSIPLWGHSHTLSSLPVQFRSLMWTGFRPSRYWPVSGIAPVETISTLCQCRIDDGCIICCVRFSHMD